MGTELQRIAAVFRDLEAAEDAADVLVTLGADLQQISLLTRATHSEATTAPAAEEGKRFVEAARAPGTTDLAAASEPVEERVRTREVLLTAYVPATLAREQLLAALTERGAQDVSFAEEPSAGTAPASPSGVTSAGATVPGTTGTDAASVPRP